MNRDWGGTFDRLWHSPSFPMWMTLAAAGFFALILLITLFRAEKSVANGALTVITLLAIGIAVTAMVRVSRVASGLSPDMRIATQLQGPLPALSCLDGLAGESVEAACEKALFASAEAVAAAVSYTAAQISRLASFGNVATANGSMTPELQALRRTIERDRYGLVAHVLMVREGCTLTGCGFFQSLTNSAQISTNMNDELYEGLVSRYAPTWNASVPVASLPSSSSPVAPVTPPTASLPPGRPVSGDFPSAASIPPVSIMTPEPPPPAARPSTEAATAPASPQARAVTPPAAKKPAAPKARPSAPVPLAPPAESDDN